MTTQPKVTSRTVPRERIVKIIFAVALLDIIWAGGTGDKCGATMPATIEQRLDNPNGIVLY